MPVGLRASALLVVWLAALPSCGPTERMADEPPGDPIVIPPVHLAGQLVEGLDAPPRPLTGLHYRSASVAGFTDATGAYAYAEGEALTFSVGDIDIATVPGAPQLTLFTLAGTTPCAM